MSGWQVGLIAAACLAIGGGLAVAAELRAEMYKPATATSPGEAVGTVTIGDAGGVAAVKTALKGLPPGPHGFHIHQNGSCDPTTPAGGQLVAFGAAGGHYDPRNTGRHEGPQGSGHLGDLPVLEVGSDGTANVTVTAPHIKDGAALKGKAMIIHAGGDNYSDQPQPLGGGGDRIACGIIR
jgi:superoxide dismutase, Cu-Zn family